MKGTEFKVKTLKKTYKFLRDVLFEYHRAAVPFHLAVRPDHEITKYGIHSFMQITLAVDKELTYR